MTSTFSGYDRKPAILQENGDTPRLYGSVSQPNLVPVSPTPKSHDEHQDLKQGRMFGKNNNLSFEDESVVKVQSTFVIGQLTLSYQSYSIRCVKLYKPFYIMIKYFEH